MSGYLFCDFCNEMKVFNKTYKLPDAWAEALGLPLGSTAARGYAPFGMTSGWTEVSDGVDRCPVCTQEEKERKSFKGKKGAVALQAMAKALESAEEK